MKFLSRITSFGIGIKLYIAFGLLVVCALVISLISLQRFQGATNLLDVLVNEKIAAVTGSSEITGSFNSVDNMLSSLLIARSKQEGEIIFQELSSEVESLKGQLEVITVPDEQKSQIEGKIAEINDMVQQAKELNNKSLDLRRNIDKLVDSAVESHEKIMAELAPIYDDAEFALMLEIDDAIALGGEETKSFIETQNSKLTNTLKLQSQMNATVGLYRESKMLTNKQLLIPLRERFTAASTQIEELLVAPGISDEIRAHGTEFIAIGQDKDGLFVKVESYLDLHQRLDEFKSTFSEYKMEISDKLFNMAAGIKEKSEQEAGNLMLSLSSGSNLMLILLGLFIAVVLACAFLFIRPQLLRRIELLSESMDSVREGNLSTTIPVSGSDEITGMFKALKDFRDALKRTKDMEAEQEELKKAAERSQKEARVKMANSFKDAMSGIINEVNTASEGLTKNASTVQSSINNSNDAVKGANTNAAGTTENVNSVAAAVEEMAVTVNEISKQTLQADEIVKDSMQSVEKADKQAKELSEASQRVRDVMQVISDIAEQINLLALNATIEAARSGEAGKGFAVVANEVKNLAAETDQSITEIEEVVQSMQEVASGIIGSLTEVKGSVTNMAEASSNVASAVEEQTATANDITGSMQNAAQSTNDISASLGNIVDEISVSRNAAEEMMISSEDVHEKALMLEKELQEFLQGILNDEGNK